MRRGGSCAPGIRASPLRGRGPRGARVVGRVPQGHWKLLTILAAVTAHGVLAAATVDAATDAVSVLPSPGSALLTITTFLHLDKFHLASPLLITRFVTWVWIAVYVVVPPLLAIAWIVQSRQPGANAKGTAPLPVWMRGGFALLGAFALLCGLALFLAPEATSAIWPWAVTPLAARAVSSWLSAFGVACVSLVLENDIRNGTGTSSSWRVRSLVTSRASSAASGTCWR